jgi:cobalt-zinc-cadmium efflux system outer membrane protein
MHDQLVATATSRKTSVARRRPCARSVAIALPLTLVIVGCHAGHPSSQQIDQTNQLLVDRAATRWNVAALLENKPTLPPEPMGDLTLREATERALAHNLLLIASAENLSIAHAQLVQAGLIQNPTIGQTGATYFPLPPNVGAVAFDVLLSQSLNSIFTLDARKSIAAYQEVQANIDMATQGYQLAQQVDGKYQEMVSLLRRRTLAMRIQDLYARAVRAAEARRKVGIIATPELNRARLNFEDARRQIQHLTTQFSRASREMNWLMGYSTAPQWHIPQAVVEDVGTVPNAPDPAQLERLGEQYRLDLMRAGFDRRVGRRSVELARLGIIPQTTLGIDYAADASKNQSLGPQFQFTLPIFDPGLVAVELAKAQARKAEKTYAALQGQVHQDVRTAFDNWRIAGDDVKFFRERLIPQQEENVRLMETSFRLGNDDLDTLLNVYQSYVTQLQAFEDAIQAYHDSGVALQQAVGLTWDRILARAGMAPAASQPSATTVPAIIPLAGTEPATRRATQPSTVESPP